LDDTIRQRFLLPGLRQDGTIAAASVVLAALIFL
jgi:hypothetical protein